jgi:hypothetical protein
MNVFNIHKTESNRIRRDEEEQLQKRDSDGIKTDPNYEKSYPTRINGGKFKEPARGNTKYERTNS